MAKALQLLIALTCVAVLAFIGLHFYREARLYVAAQRDEKIKMKAREEEIARLVKDAEKREAEEKLLLKLSNGKCIELANSVIANAASVNEIKSADLEVCMKYGMLNTYHVDELTRIGVLLPTFR